MTWLYCHSVNFNVVTCRCIMVRDLPGSKSRWLYLHNRCFWVRFSRTYSIVFHIKLHIFWYLLLWDNLLYFSILLFSDTQGTHTSTDSRTVTPIPPKTLLKNRTVTRTTLQVAPLLDRDTRRMARATPQKQVAPPLVLARRNQKRARTTSNSSNNSSNRNRNRHSLSSRSSPRTDAQGKRSWSTYFCSNFFATTGTPVFWGFFLCVLFFRNIPI